MRQKFYGACNSVLRRSRGSEIVKVQLLKSYRLPLLMYSLGGLSLKTCDVRQLGVCWNDGFRMIFNMHRWESVKFVQFMCGEVPFDHLYDIAKLQFYIKSIPKCSFVYNLSQVFLSEHNVVYDIFAKYGIDNVYGTLHNFVNVIQLKFCELVLDEYS